MWWLSSNMRIIFCIIRLSWRCGTQPDRRITIDYGHSPTPTPTLSSCVSRSTAPTVSRTSRRNGRRRWSISARTCRSSSSATRRIWGTTATQWGNWPRWSRNRYAMKRGDLWRKKSMPLATWNVQLKLKMGFERCLKRPPKLHSKLKRRRKANAGSFKHIK